MVFSRFHSCVAVLGKKIDFLVCVNAIDVFDILGKCYVEKVGLIPRVICYHDIMFAFIHVAAVEESDKSRCGNFAENVENMRFFGERRSVITERLYGRIFLYYVINGAEIGMIEYLGIVFVKIKLNILKRIVNGRFYAELGYGTETVVVVTRRSVISKPENATPSCQRRSS